MTAIPSEASTVLQFLPAAIVSKTAERKIDNSDRSKEKAPESDNHNEPAKDNYYPDDDYGLSEQKYGLENGVPRQTPQQLKKQQEFEKRIQDQYRMKIAKTLGQSPLEKLTNSFREVFLSIQAGVNSREDWAIYTSIEKSLPKISGAKISL